MPFAADVGVLHYLIYRLRRKFENAAPEDKSEQPCGANDVPPAPPPRRPVRQIARNVHVQQSSGHGTADPTLQQRVDVLESQIALAETAVRDAAQRLASSQNQLEAVQDKLEKLTTSFAHQSHEWSAQHQRIQQQEASQANALQCLMSVVSCSKFALRHLTCLSPRVMSSSQEPPPPPVARSISTPTRSTIRRPTKQ
jgi:uncharacterized coiled-coil protein SlyX